MHAGLFKLLGLVLESIPGVLNQAAPTMKAAELKTKELSKPEQKTTVVGGRANGKRRLLRTVGLQSELQASLARII